MYTRVKRIKDNFHSMSDKIVNYFLSRPAFEIFHCNATLSMDTDMIFLILHFLLWEMQSISWCKEWKLLHTVLTSTFHQNSRFPVLVGVKSHSRSGCFFFFRRIASFHTISSHFTPLPVSVYKRSPGDGGQRCLVGLVRSSPVIWDWPLLCTFTPSSPFAASFLEYVARSGGEFQVSEKRGGTSSDQTRK